MMPHLVHALAGPSVLPVWLTLPHSELRAQIASLNATQRIPVNRFIDRSLAFDELMHQQLVEGLLVLNCAHQSRDQLHNWGKAFIDENQVAAEPLFGFVLFFPGFIHLRVIATLSHKFIVWPHLTNTFVIHDSDQISPACRGQSMRDNDGRSSLQQSIQGSFNTGFTLLIHVGGRFIEDQHARSTQKRPCQRKQLPLTGRQGRSSLVAGGIQPLRQSIDHVFDPNGSAGIQ